MVFLDVFEEFGVRVKRGRDYVKVEGGEFKVVVFDCFDFLDLFFILVVVVVYVEGRSVIRVR